MSAFSLVYSPRSVPFPLQPVHNAPLPRLRPKSKTSAVSATCLSPVHFRRKITRLVSYYALFKWWLPLSQHPSCLCNLTSFSTEHVFGALTGDLGCFPFHYEAYPPQCDSTCVWNGFRSLNGVSTLVRAIIQSVLYLHSEHSRRLALKLFRGEPAITGFGKPFTPTHSSSEYFSTYNGSDLRSILLDFHPGHG